MKLIKIIGALAILGAASSANAISIIDDFNQATLVGPPPEPIEASSNSAALGSYSDSPGGSILGGERDVLAQWTGGSGHVTARVCPTCGDYQHSQDTSVTGWSRVIWDGSADADKINVDTMGLGGVDLTETDAVTHLVFKLVSADLFAKIDITFWDTLGNFFTKEFDFVGGAVNETVITPFAAWTDVDFSTIGAVALEVNGRDTASLDVSIDFIGTTTVAAPGTLAVLGLGLLGMGLRRAKK